MNTSIDINSTEATQSKEVPCRIEIVDCCKDDITVCHTHRMLVNQSALRSAYLGFSQKERDEKWFSIASYEYIYDLEGAKTRQYCELVRDTFKL